MCWTVEQEPCVQTWVGRFSIVHKLWTSIVRPATALKMRSMR